MAGQPPEGSCGEMRPIPDARKRWSCIFDNHTTADSVRRSAAQRSSTNPCVSGLRSICWKLFLLNHSICPQAWLPILRKQRNTYDYLCAKYLTLLNGGDIGAPDIDPLADDDSNPWEQYRRDTELRDEIFQDIERCMPDNTFFRDPKVQSWLLNILFVYCREYSDVGYRQGFHEIAAVVLWVVYCDAAERGKCEEEDQDMLEALDERFIESDSFTLFHTIMRKAKAWYELEDGNSLIIQKSRYIHETLLMATDPELGEHLKGLDVLPQVFLIRWIRLLFSREFPFEELLEVWDTLFAEDTDLHLVDLVCVSMLLRIRWQLLEADYSTALTLVLRYPSPSSPPSLVTDAIYLRDNLSTSGGSEIITKYSKRPRSPPSRPSRPDTSRRPQSPGTAKSLFPVAHLESVVQDVTKSVLDRSQKWSVNRAVRDTVTDVRKSYTVSTIMPTTPPPTTSSTDEGELVKQNAELIKRLRASEERSRQLARILELSISSLPPDLPADATSRLDYIKECLLDDTKPLDKSLLQPSAPRPRPTIHRRIPSEPGSGFVKTSFKNNSDTEFMVRSERPRATLAQSSFAWMLGDDPATKNKSGFVPRAEGGKQVEGVGLGDLKKS